jgi:hypothetical protein
MSRTTRTNKGKEYRQQGEKKRLKEKKFFGWTSGQHSKSDRAVPIQGREGKWSSDPSPDYVKYGWPMEIRSKGKVIEKDKYEEAIEEIREARERAIETGEIIITAVQKMPRRD